MNLITNPGFEQDWNGSHRCFVFQDDGSYYEADIGNIFTPNGWVTWFKHNDTLAQPEVTDAWRYQDDRRVHSGEKACHLFTFAKLHDGGLLQQVEVEPGSMVSFTIWAQAWSNHKGAIEDFPHPDDGLWSDGSLVGYDVIALSQGQIPQLNGDAQNDANGNIQFSVGIDPSGGVDPYAETVIWGEPLHSYNGHHKLPSVEAVARGDMVTVFTRSITLWPFKHNDVYYDDAELTVSDTPPPSGECPGQPRIDYERTYVLMPPGTDEADVKLIIANSWARHQWTVGGSADDAGIGNLSNKCVIAVRPSMWGDDLRAFFETHYNDPPVTYWPLEYDNQYQLLGGLLAYSLRVNGFKLERPTTHDEMIVTGRYGVPRGDYTHNGLDLRSSAAVWDDEIISATTGEVVRVGLYGDAPGYGYQVRVLTTTADGREVWVRYAHLVEDSITVQIGDAVLVGDVIGLPGSTGDSTADHLHIDVWAVDKQAYADPALLLDYWKDDVGPPPPPPPPPPSGLSTIGLHVQSPSADGDGFGDVQYVAMVKPSVMKLVGNMQKAREYKAVSPETKTVYRHFTAWQDYYKAPNLQEAAWDFLREFLDSLLEEAEYIDYAEGLNEVALQCGFVDPRFIEFERQFAIALNDATSGEVAPSLGGIAVGNPEHRPAIDFVQMIPMVEAVVEFNGAINYHGYVRCDYGNVDWDAEYHYSMRALLSMDPYFNSLGLYPRYIHGETGAFVNAKDGWRKSNCLNGDKAAYVALLKELDRRCKLSPAGLRGDFVGNTIFTANAGRDDWRYYDIHPDYRYFAEALS